MKQNKDLIKAFLFMVLIIAIAYLIIITPEMQNKFTLSIVGLGISGFILYAFAWYKPNGQKVIKLYLGFFLLGTIIGIIIPYINPQAIQIIAEILLAFTFTKTALVMALAYKAHKRKSKITLKDEPFVSILSPCYNEELTLENCVTGLINQTYKNYEIIIINDGSTDGTQKVGEKLAKKYKNVRILNKKNGGKASALNYGIKYAKGDYLICIDGDSVFKEDAVAQLMSSFNDPTVVAVAGNPKVANIENILTRIQALEYTVGFNLEKAFFSELGCIQVISGAIGAFRKDKLLEVGGYSTDTIVEDMDLTLALAKKNYKIVFNPRAIAYCESPKSIKDIIKQRYRWYFGAKQALKKYKEMLFKHQYGNLGMFGLPYFVLSPWIDLITSIITIALIVEAIMFGIWLNFIMLFGVFMLISIGILFYTIWIAEVPNIKKITPYILIQSVFYVYLLNYIVLTTWLNYNMGKSASWGRITRYGTNHTN